MIYEAIRTNVLDKIPGRLHLSTPVQAVRAREDGQVELTLATGKVMVYSDVIMTVNADIARRLLDAGGGPVSLMTKYILSQVQYEPLEAVLHTDETVMPEDKSAWSLYNIRWGDSMHWAEDLEMTGRLGHMFGYRTDPEVFLSINLKPDGQPAAEKVHKRMHWQHHKMDIWHLVLVLRFLVGEQGKGHIHFAGAWSGGVGHNDAMQSGVKAACAVGLSTSIPVDLDDNVSSPSTNEIALYRYLLRKYCGVELDLCSRINSSECNNEHPVMDSTAQLTVPVALHDVDTFALAIQGRCST